MQVPVTILSTEVPRRSTPSHRECQCARAYMWDLLQVRDVPSLSGRARQESGLNISGGPEKETFSAERGGEIFGWGGVVWALN